MRMVVHRITACFSPASFLACFWCFQCGRDPCRRPPPPGTSGRGPGRSARAVSAASRDVAVSSPVLPRCGRLATYCTRGQRRVTATTPPLMPCETTALIPLRCECAHTAGVSSLDRTVNLQIKPPTPPDQPRTAPDRSALDAQPYDQTYCHGARHDGEDGDDDGIDGWSHV